VTVERSGGERVAIAWHDSPSPRASVLVLPALGVAAAYYAPLAETLSRRGLAVAAVDHRGIGGSSVRVRRGVDFGYAALSEDTRIVIRSTTPPVFVLGHSLGGHVGALAAAEGAALAGIALIASGTPYHERFVARVSRWIRFGTAVIPRIADVVGYYPGTLLGFGGSEARTLMTEWAAVARTGHFVVDGENRDNALAQVALPVLAVSLDHDWMAPASAVDHLVEKMPRAAVQRVHLSDAPRETLHHFRWARHPAPIVEIVDRWIQEVTA
jgi:predicted alpha/beta hydrolase